jgi:alkylation response protein AidB-like acyl-CoA dehydrogenase
MEVEARYHPSREQRELAGALNEALADLLPIARVHQAPEESPEIWAALDALGLFGIALEEQQGGSGLGAAEEALVVLSLGRQLAAPSILATLGAVHARPAAGVAGRRVAAGYRSGGRAVMVEAPLAELLLLRGETDAILLDAPASTRAIDDSLWSARLCESMGLGEPRATFGPAAVLRLRLIDAAALAGLAEAALDMAVAYAKVREQFGRPIGSFQAVKHHCANMAIAARSARDQVTFAAIAIDDGREDAALQVECALLTAGEAALENAGKNIQIHGGIGFSDEADPHLILKRTRVLLALAGGLEAAVNRIADLEPRL